MILSQIQSCRFLADIDWMFSCTIMNSGMEATSKLAPALNRVRTMPGSGLALTA